MHDSPLCIIPKCLGEILDIKILKKNILIKFVPYTYDICALLSNCALFTAMARGLSGLYKGTPTQDMYSRTVVKWIRG